MFTAGICTIVTLMSLCVCMSSQRNDSWKPWIACLAPQYARLQGDAAIGERRSDLHDRARGHAASSGLSAAMVP